MIFGRDKLIFGSNRSKFFDDIQQRVFQVEQWQQNLISGLISVLSKEQWSEFMSNYGASKNPHQSNVAQENVSNHFMRIMC